MTRLYPFRPQEPRAARPEDAAFPCLVVPKLEGARWTVVGNVLLGRDLRPVRDEALQTVFGRPEFEGLEGVFTDRSLPWEESEAHVFGPEVKFFVLDDHTDEDLPFRARLDQVRERVDALPEIERFQVAEGLHSTLANAAELRHYLYVVAKNGYTHVWLRDPKAPYRRGGAPGDDGWFLEVPCG